MAKPLMPQRTIQYKTYLKRAIVTALKGAFANHPDELIRRTKVTIEYPQTQADYPTIVVRFFERDIRDSGIGHSEWIKGITIPGDGVVTMTGTIPVPLPEWAPAAELLSMNVVGYADTEWIVDSSTGTIARKSNSAIPSGQQVALEYTYHQPNAYTRMKHSLYDGTIQLVIYALSSLDRDLVSDSLVEVIRHGDIAAWTNNFFEHIYDRTPDDEPYSNYHYVNIDSDNLKSYGETQAIAPWMAEDVMAYQATYGFEVFGELYSTPPTTGYPLVEEVDVFPYIEDLEPRPDGANDPAPWITDADTIGEP